MEWVFWNSDNMTLFWTYLKGLIKTAAPGFMIFAALMIMGQVISMIRDSIFPDSYKNEYDEEDDD